MLVIILENFIHCVPAFITFRNVSCLWFVSSLGVIPVTASSRSTHGVTGIQVTARVTNPPPLKLQSFDGLVDHTCLEDSEKRGGLLSKVRCPCQI